MKTGLVSVSFRQLSAEEIIRLAVRCGLNSIEWGGDVHVPPGEIELAHDVGNATRSAGLEAACYGSYYRLTDSEVGMAEKVIDTALALGAPLIRVWAGVYGSAEASQTSRKEVCRNAQRLALLAKDVGLDIAFEWHGGTLTDTCASALELLRAVNMPNVGTLWQPPVNMPSQECVHEIRAAGEYIRNIHVFSWNGTQRLPLAEGAKKWNECLTEIAGLTGEHQLLLEFVRGDDPERLYEDAACLKAWLKGR